MIKKHKVFISYDRIKDQKYRDELKDMCANITVLGSVEIEVIDVDSNTEIISQAIRTDESENSSVTIVLIGEDTWKKKEVDWQIAASLRTPMSKFKNGLLGIILPTHSSYHKDEYNPGSIPPRFYDNVGNGYADFYDWSTDNAAIQNWIDAALNKSVQIVPNNSRALYQANRVSNQEGWC